MKNAASRAATTSGASPDVNMSIRRFVAENSRTALRQVRDTLGGDAIILANRSIEGGVEVLAAAPEAVDALTRRIAAPTPDASTLAAEALRATMPPTPTELGLKPATRQDAVQSVGRKGLASLFGRRSPAQATPVAPTPVAATAAASAAASYLSFAERARGPRERRRGHARRAASGASRAAGRRRAAEARGGRRAGAGRAGAAAGRLVHRRPPPARRSSAPRNCPTSSRARCRK